MHAILTPGLGRAVIREWNESSESEKPIRRIRRIRGQAIALFSCGCAWFGLDEKILSLPVHKTPPPSIYWDEGQKKSSADSSTQRKEGAR
jgi:hypothetical protein